MSPIETYLGFITFDNQMYVCVHMYVRTKPVYPTGISKMFFLF